MSTFSLWEQPPALESFTPPSNDNNNNNKLDFSSSFPQSFVSAAVGGDEEEDGDGFRDMTNDEEFISFEQMRDDEEDRSMDRDGSWLKRNRTRTDDRLFDEKFNGRRSDQELKTREMSNKNLFFDPFDHGETEHASDESFEPQVDLNYSELHEDDNAINASTFMDNSVNVSASFRKQNGTPEFGLLLETDQVNHADGQSFGDRESMLNDQVNRQSIGDLESTQVKNADKQNFRVRESMLTDQVNQQNFDDLESMQFNHADRQSFESMLTDTSPPASLPPSSPPARNEGGASTPPKSPLPRPPSKQSTYDESMLPDDDRVSPTESLSESLSDHSGNYTQRKMTPLRSSNNLSPKGPSASSSVSSLNSVLRRTASASSRDLLYSPFASPKLPRTTTPKKDLNGNLARKNSVDNEREKKGKAPPTSMTLRDQEKMIDEVKKENFGLKLKIFYLEERLNKLSPEHMEHVLKENIDMKVDLKSLANEVKTYKRLLLEAHSAIETLQTRAKTVQEETLHRNQNSQNNQKDQERESLKNRDLENQLSKLTEHLRTKEDELFQTKSQLERTNEQLLLQRSQEREREFERREEARKLDAQIVILGSEAKKALDDQRREWEKTRSVDAKMLETELRQREADLRNMDENLRKQISETREREDDLHKAQIQIEFLTTHKTTLASKISSLSATIIDLKSQNDQLVVDLDYAQKEGDKARRELGERERTIKIQLTELQRASEIREDTWKRNASEWQKDERRLKDELEKMREGRNSLVEKRVLKEDTENAKREEAEKWKITVRDLKEQVSSLKAQTSSQAAILHARAVEMEQVQRELDSARFRTQPSPSLSLKQSSQSRTPNPTTGSTSPSLRRSESWNPGISSHSLHPSIAEGIGALRDQVTELTLQVRAKQDEIDSLTRELDDSNTTHARTLQTMTDTWSREATRLRDMVTELRNEATVGHAEAQKAQDTLQEERDAWRTDWRKSEEKMRTLEDECSARERDCENGRELIRKLTAQVSNLETVLAKRTTMVHELEEQLDERSQTSRLAERTKDEELTELKEKLSSAKTKLTETTLLHQNDATEIAFLREQISSYTCRLSDLEERWRREVERRCTLEERETELLESHRLALSNLQSEHSQSMDRELAERREQVQTQRDRIESLESEINSLQSQIIAANSAREEMEKSTNVLRASVAVQREHEAEIVRLEEHWKAEIRQCRERETEMDREAQRWKREFESVAQDREGVARDLERMEREKEAVLLECQKLRREKDLVSATLTERKEDLEKLLAIHRQSSAKLHDATSSLQSGRSHVDTLESKLFDATRALSNARTRIQELENRIGNLVEQERQVRDMIGERNTLLVVVAEYLDVIDGGTSNGNKGVDDKSLPRPTQDFEAFNHLIVGRLKGLHKLQTSFEKKGREWERRCHDQLEALRRQLDTKLGQMEKFQTIVRNASSVQRKWRDSVLRKQEELSSVTRLCEEHLSERGRLSDQVNSLLRERDDLVSLLGQARKASAEGGSRAMEAVERWQERAKELEQTVAGSEKKVREAEERVKRERTGAKERVAELMATVQSLERQLEASTRKGYQLQELVDLHKQQLQQVSQQRPPSTGPFPLVSARAEATLSKVNEQLREEVDEKNREVDEARKRITNLEKDCESARSEVRRMQKSLQKRESLIGKALARLELINDRKDMMEMALLREVTDDVHQLMRRTSSALDSHPPSVRATTPDGAKTSPTPTAPSRPSPFRSVSSGALPVRSKS